MVVLHLIYSTFLSLDISRYFLERWPAWCDIVVWRYQLSTSLMKVSRFHKWNLETGVKFIGCSFWRKKSTQRKCNSQHWSNLQKKKREYIFKYFGMVSDWWRPHDVREAPFWNVLVLYGHCSNSFRPPPLPSVKRANVEKSAPNHTGKL